MPPDISALATGISPSPEARSDLPDRPTIVCAWAPWTICYRPLYFEDIPLERYGENWGALQTFVSAGRFYKDLALIPYKVVVRPPRSLVCDNGFSRCGDEPLPGYTDCIWRWDAAMVEAALVAGIVVALP